MNPKPRRSARSRSAFSSELPQEARSEEDSIKFGKIGLLALRVVSLEKEVAVFAKRIDEAKRRITELPCEIEEREKLLAEVIADRKVLERLESGK